MTTLETSRLVSRPWQAADLDDFAALCADPQVMELVGGVQSRETAAAVIEKAMAHQARFGIWIQPLVLKETGAFIGIAGIAEVMFESTFTPAVEIGWRLTPAHWGQGYITEIAREHLHHAFEARDLEQIVAFTVPQNTRSRAVMHRLNMAHRPESDFDHPRVGDGNAHLRRHVLYSLSREDWRASVSSPPEQAR